MALWEYKVITSGRGGFATPALLETYLNQLGTDEWEIIQFRTQPDNPLAFQGLARRLTQREWTLEAAATAAAKVEADKLRAEFAAKFQAATSGTAGETKPAVVGAEPGEPVRDDSFRPLRNTEHDQDPDALDETSEAETDEWPEEDQLPTFFDAIRPHMRRNQKGPGYSVSVDYLVKKFEMMESDFLGALKDCGFPMPEDEDDKPVYLEYDGDIYWLNVNRRGEHWINTREKPRPVFKIAKATPLNPEVVETRPESAETSAEGGEPTAPRETRSADQGARGEDRNRRRDGRRQRPDGRDQPPAEVGAKPEGTAETPSAGPAPEVKAAVEPTAAPAATTLPTGPELLDKLRPFMRRSRGGFSGTISFLARALKCRDNELNTALATLGIQVAPNGGDKPPVVEVGNFAYWLNKDGRGGVWINVAERKAPKAEAGQSPAEAPVPTVEPAVVPAPVVDSAAQSTPVTPVAVPAEGPAEPAPSTAPAVVETPALPEPVPAIVAPVVTEVAAGSPLAAVRLLLKETKPGSFAGEASDLARLLGKTDEAFLNALVGAGLRIPEKAREKPFFAEHAGEIFWLNKSAKGELWLNAKASQFSAKKTDEAATSPEGDGDQKKTPRGSRPRKKSPEAK